MDIVEELRAQVVPHYVYRTGESPRPAGTRPDPMCARAADEIERLRAEAERWRMTLLVNREVMIQPEKRKHQAAVDAYMAAVREGLNLEAAIEAALERHNAGHQGREASPA
jgi:sugar phosphate isomerase/epimerase